MPLLNTTHLEAAEAVKRIAGEFKNPRGVPWKVAELESATESQVKIRAWEHSEFSEHKCHVIFTIDDHGETSIVETSTCNDAHYASELEIAAITALNEEYGQEQAETSPAAAPVADAEVPVPLQPTEMPAQPGVVAQTEAHLQSNHVVDPGTPAQPDAIMSEQPGNIVPNASPVASQAIAGGEQYALRENVLERRLEAIEQTNLHLGETLKQLTGQVDTIEERTAYLQQYGLSIELNLNLLWVLRFLSDKSRIRNPEIQQSADAAVAELHDAAAKVQQSLWNGTDHDLVRHEWAVNCHTVLTNHGLSDYYGTEKKDASQTA
jgi:hypothetical protein